MDQAGIGRHGTEAFKKLVKTFRRVGAAQQRAEDEELENKLLESSTLAPKERRVTENERKKRKEKAEKNAKYGGGVCSPGGQRGFIFFMKVR